MQHADVAVIGAGVVGLAAAYQLLKQEPSLGVVVLEKELGPARHQTGHNSGILHSGVNYRPGSLRAVHCRAGRRAMVQFCEAEGIPHEICGEVIVAPTERDVPVLEGILGRGQANGVGCELIDRGQLAALEPNVAGAGALHIPETGIVDFREVSARLATRIAEAGGQLRYQCELRALSSRRGRLVLHTTEGDLEVAEVANCAGLQADRVARLNGHDPGMRIVPLRTEYYRLSRDSKGLVRNLVSTAPDGRQRSLAVNFHRTIHGEVECEASTVPAGGREAYERHQVSPRDLMQSVLSAGLVRSALGSWRTGAQQVWRTVNKAAFVRAVSQLVPQIRSENLIQSEAGIRAQAVLPDGKLVDDFVIDESRCMVSLLSAPAPGATAAFHLGRILSRKVIRNLEGSAGERAAQ